MKTSTMLSLALFGALFTLVSTAAHAAPGAMAHYGGALDPVSASLALGLGGLALWKARTRSEAIDSHA